MSPSEIRELCVDLKCTARELAATLGIDFGEVAAWEQGERFPTKKDISDLAKLRLLGPAAITRKPKRQVSATLRGTARLADPALWQIVLKLTEHPDFFEKVRQLAENYTLPSDPDANKR